MGQDTLQHFYAATRALEPSDQLVTRTLDQHARGARSATRSSGRRRRNRRVVLLAAAATLAIATTAVSAVSLGLVQLDDPSHQLVDPKAAQTSGLPVIMTAPEATGLYCRAPGRIVEAGATGGDPVAICAALWQKGVVSGTAEEPPALQACVGTNGAIEVYPGTNACAANGRPVAAPYSPADVHAITLAKQLRAWAATLPNGCASNVAQATDGVNKIVAQLGLTNDGWRIGTSSPNSPMHTSAENCIIPTTFAAEKIIYLG